MRQLDYGNWYKELNFRPRLYEENLSRAEGSPAYPSFPGRGKVSRISLQNMDGEPFKLQKLARLEGWPTLSSHSFVMVGTLSTFHSTKFLFEVSEKPLAQWKVHSSCTDQTKATASLVIVLVSKIQISGPGENDFVKWNGTFRSDRQIRSVSVKSSHSQGADN